MNTLIKILGIFAALSLLISGCGAGPIQAEQETRAARNTAAYEDLLGKSLTDEGVAAFITTNNCSSIAQFQQCRDVGVALWINPEQIVQTVYLYLNKAEGFAPYKGELPFGLKFYDTMGAVVYKLGEREEDDNSQTISTAGLTDEVSSPDHTHYWAAYKRLGMIIIYNSPFADEDATIYAILVSK